MSNRADQIETDVEAMRQFLLTLSAIVHALVEGSGRSFGQAFARLSGHPGVAAAAVQRNQMFRDAIARGLHEAAGQQRRAAELWQDPDWLADWCENGHRIAEQIIAKERE